MIRLTILLAAIFLACDFPKPCDGGAYTARGAGPVVHYECDPDGGGAH